MTTTPDYAGLANELEEQVPIETPISVCRKLDRAATAIRTLLESKAVLEARVEKWLGKHEQQFLRAEAAEAERDRLAETVGKVLTWAEQRCPCHNDEPNPCPLCGASVENLEACKSAENTIPASLLADLRTARSLVNGGGDG